MRNNPSTKAISLLRDISKAYPHQPLMSHLCIALQEFSSIDMVTDKELAFQLNKYFSERELDIEPSRLPLEDEVDRIIREGSDLDNLFSNDEDEDDF